MIKTKQMDIIMLFIRVLIVVIIGVMAVWVVVARGGDVDSNNWVWVLNEQVMWLLGVLGSFAAIVAAILWRHDHDITELQSRPRNVPEDVCLANMTLLQNELDHGVARFEKIEATFIKEQDAASRRHDELMSTLREMSK